jgi:hypothetical protein
MRVIATADVRSYVETHGGVLYVNAHRRQCCSGSLTVLDSSTREPADQTGYGAADADGFLVRFRAGGDGDPEELVIEMKGLLRKHPVAYWNGCAFKI